MCMRTEGFAGRHERVMIDGKVKYHLAVQIIILEHLIQNGMLLQFMVSHKMIINSQNNIYLIFKIPSFFLSQLYSAS